MTHRFYDYTEEFLHRTRKNNQSAQILDDRRRVLNKLEDYLKEENISIHLTNSHEFVSKIRDFFEDTDISLTGTYVSAIIAYLEFLSIENIEEENKVDSCVILLRKKLKPESERVNEIQRVEAGLLKDNQKIELLDNCETLEEELIVRILLDTGIKASELHTLKPRDLKKGDSLNPGYLRIRRHKASKGDIEPHGENFKEDEREVAIRLETLRKIEKHIQENLSEDDEFLLWGHPDYPKTRRHFNKVISKCGFSEEKKDSLSLEPFRSNAMVSMIQKGYSRRNIKEYMGKTSLLTSKTMEKYSNSREKSPLALHENLY